MHSFQRNGFTLEDAHAAPTAAGYCPTRLNNRSRFNFNSAACHGGDAPTGCWATELDGRVYFHCHVHSPRGGSKADWMRAQERITDSLNLPEYPPADIAAGGGKPYQVRRWTYHNAEGETTAESAAALGWRAYSYQGGANGVGRADYSPVAGLSVLYAPDHDRPGNRAALTAAIRCIEAGATDVRIMPVDCFHRRGEDLADLNPAKKHNPAAVEPWDDHPALVLDAGCRAAPSCLACPLPRCPLDEPISADRSQMAA